MHYFVNYTDLRLGKQFPGRFAFVDSMRAGATCAFSHRSGRGYIEGPKLRRINEMAVLSTKRRKALPKSSFGEPGRRAYPMPDKSHARNALARASQMVNAGKLSPGAAARVRAKARGILGK